MGQHFHSQFDIAPTALSHFHSSYDVSEPGKVIAVTFFLQTFAEHSCEMCDSVAQLDDAFGRRLAIRQYT